MVYNNIIIYLENYYKNCMLNIQEYKYSKLSIETLSFFMYLIVNIECVRDNHAT